MDTNELLRKRVIVTAYYPNCPFEVGEVLVKSAFGYYFSRARLTHCSNIVDCLEIEKSGANFRGLKFWEFREEKDLPTYVKLVWENEPVTVHKVERWDLENRYVILKFLKCGRPSEVITFDNSGLQPATEQEYIEYMNT